MNETSPDRLAAGFAQAVQKGDWPAALKLAEALEIALPGNAGAVYNKALVLRELGRHDERIATLRQALEIDAGHANAGFELASALMEQGEAGEASGLFAAYLNAVPDDTDARLNLGNCLVRLGRADEALPHLRAAHIAAPSEATVAALATALRDTGDLDACETLLAELPETPEAAALRLKVLTQGARGRISLKTA